MAALIGTDGTVHLAQGCVVVFQQIRNCANWHLLHSVMSTHANALKSYFLFRNWLTIKVERWSTYYGIYAE